MLPSSLFISMRFRRPGGGEDERAERANDDQSRKAHIPAVVLNQRPQAPARQYSAGVAKYAGQANRGGSGAIGGQVRGGHCQQTLRAVDEKARGPKQSRG